MRKCLSVSQNINISSGDGYYDVNCSFPIEELLEIVEEVGVKGGHIGWQLKFETKPSYDFGRKYHYIMKELLEYVKDNDLEVKHTVLNDVPTKCY